MNINNKKNMYFFLCVMIFELVIVFCNIKNNNISNKDTFVNNKEKEYSFIKYGIVSKDSELYVKINNEYIKNGTIYKNVELSFLDIEGSYLKIDGFDEKYYIDVENVVEQENIEIKDERYKKYILFNENIVTGINTAFYSENDDILFSFEKSYELPVIIKENGKYGVEFGEQLLYVKEDDIEEVVVANNTVEKNSSGVGVLNYHFFYDDNDLEQINLCNQVICHSKTQFQSQLDYLKDNNILTITMKELEWYIDGKINLPRSVLITIDDGWLMELGVEMLEENEMYGNVFLITSWYENTDFRNYYKYVNFYSHGENLHSVGVCPGGQGGAIKCLGKDSLLSDLEVSSNKLGGSKVFAYPFYEYNDYSIDVLKEAGYTMAFAGESTNSDNLVHVGSDKYELPRFVIVSYTTEKDLDKYFSNIY